MSTTTETTPAAQEFADRVFAGAIGAFETFSIYVGDRLGLYGALAEAGPLSAAELAARTKIDERYAREWLEQQAVAGILGVVDEKEPRFAMPAAHVAVLCNQDSLLYSAPLARMVAASATHLPDLLGAYRTGGGVAWAELGEDARDAQGDLNRPWFEHRLAAALSEVPDVHDRLSRDGARVADIGCGHGWSTIALARAYPQASVEGFDVDRPSIDAARRHAEGVPNARFAEVNGTDAAASGPFDVAFVFEALHDMPHPIAVLAAMRESLAPDGVVVIMDEAVADRFAPNGDEVERIMYGYSLFICLPDGMSTPGSAATGTVLRPATLERYAKAAGYRAVEQLPIEDFGAFRFTMLRP